MRKACHRRFLPLWLVIWCCLLSLATPVSGALPQRALRSNSGQFVVAIPEAGPRPAPVVGAVTNAAALVDIDPPSLLLTCERVKKALLWELGPAADLWRGTIYVVVNPALANGQAPVIGAQAFRQGWAYRMEVPPKVSPLPLVRGVVQVLLMEMANRRGGARSAEIPLWLSEGLTLQLARTSLVDLTVARPQEVVGVLKVRTSLWETRRADPLAEARERLQGHAAMSVFRMGETMAEDLGGETWLTFQASAQLFVSSLLQGQGGRASLFEMVHRLSAFYNWQPAFLEAFGHSFRRMLDVEKWWSVTLVHFTGMDPFNAWAPSLAATRLEDVLRPALMVRAAGSGESRRTRVPLQTIIKDWDQARQQVVLQGAINHLGFMRAKLPPELAVLTDHYRNTLAEYLDGRSRILRARPVPLAPSVAIAHLVTETVRQLDELDSRRGAFQAAETARTQAAKGGR